jgi:hypothetical protein bacD2_23164
MEYIILLIVIIIIIVVIGVLISKPKTGNAIKAESNLSDNQRYYIGDKCIGLSPRKGYDKFSIAGAYYRNLPITTIGKFNGYVTAQTDNEYDEYAIAVFNDDGLHLGFLPGGNAMLHTYVSDEGGSVHAYGYIGCHNDGGMYGEVCVETDKNLVTKRNKPYAVD